MSDDTKPRITEARAEALVDRRVQQRLAVDRIYLAAENAEAQNAREAQIEAEEWSEIEYAYEVAP
jgi:hypothetical protein